jgi:hypothetical protein
MRHIAQNPTCPMPDHDDGSGRPEQHPRYREYKRWANALRTQLVQADSFWTLLWRNYPDEYPE